ncbi:MAG: UDP-N-acetylmuramate dehydrogenase [Bacteroidota bacterium]|nr:UDP-N-acetylmuramate dehydrogenase [Bacteroidota bacterium]
MVFVEENKSLKELNSFNVDVEADFFVELSDIDQALEFVRNQLHEYHNVMIIGGGCNILFTKKYKGLIVKVAFKGIEIIEENDNDIVLKVNAGEDWTDFVRYCAAREWGGVENLAMIPGDVGSSPVQNIGAYGMEVKDVVESVEAIELASGLMREFTNAECKFEYRSSIFKTELQGKYLITSVIIKLNKNPEFNLQYGSIKSEIEAMNISKISCALVEQVISRIRKEKLPDINHIGSVGSFFKNPVVNKLLFDKIKEGYRDMPYYKVGSNYKIPAGWLIEQCGWKGFRCGDAGVYPHQALVLVNYGDAKGEEIAALSVKIQSDVEKRFGIKLFPEVTIL